MVPIISGVQMMVWVLFLSIRVGPRLDGGFCGRIAGFQIAQTDMFRSR